MSAELKSSSSTERLRRLSLAGRRDTTTTGARAAGAPIRHNTAVPPVEIPPGHIGPVVLPGSGRMVYWTGRVAIGLRHQPSPRGEPVAQSALWVQELMLGPGQAAA